VDWAPRDDAWQGPQRQRDQQIRSEAVALVQAWHAQGLALAEAATLLEVPTRTLRQWRQDLVNRPVLLTPLGRAHVHVRPDEAATVVGFLHGHGPRVGLPTLRGVFPDLPRAELRDLLGLYRHLWSLAHPRIGHVLNWRRPGTVWAMDFTEVSHPIDGVWPYVLAVRDLASGMQLAWRPVANLSAVTVKQELEVLFVVCGAPLVLKSDNGSAFRADDLKAFLRRWRVWPLYSPPRRPGYNGAIEASIGSLKTRTQFEAYRQGHEGVWTSPDLETAREQANTTARPRGHRAPTPAEAWASRRPPAASERERFAAEVGPLAAAARRQQGFDDEAILDHYEQAALHREVLTQALVEGGYLTITRRRIPQRFFGQKVANFK
jgi:transposase InsO family protein